MRVRVAGIMAVLALAAGLPAYAAGGAVEYRKPDGTLLGRSVPLSNGTVENRTPDGTLISRDVPTRNGGYETRAPDGRLLGRATPR